MHLAGLWVYPVKSLRGCSVAAASVDELGLDGDRRFLVVDDQGRFLTQRALPRLALIETALDPAQLTLTAPGRPSLHVRRQPDPSAPARTVSIWSSDGLQAEDCGAEASMAMLRLALAWPAVVIWMVAVAPVTSVGI